jgi:hypothetical protein
MKNRSNTNSISLAVVLSTAMIVAVASGGCAASRQQPSAATEATGPAAVSATRSDTVRPSPQPDAAQSCRAILRRIEGAKRMWALENRKLNSEIPTDGDVFGSGRYMPEKPICPGGGTYTLRAVEYPPLCSIPGHIY